MASYGTDSQCDLDDGRAADLALSEAKTALALGRPVDAGALVGALENALNLADAYHGRWRDLEENFADDVARQAEAERADCRKARAWLRDRVERDLRSLEVGMGEFAPTKLATAVQEVKWWRETVSRLLAAVAEQPPAPSA